MNIERRDLEMIAGALLLSRGVLPANATEQRELIERAKKMATMFCDAALAPTGAVDADVHARIVAAALDSEAARLHAEAELSELRAEFDRITTPAAPAMKSAAKVIK